VLASSLALQITLHLVCIPTGSGVMSRNVNERLPAFFGLRNFDHVKNRLHEPVEISRRLFFCRVGELAGTANHFTSRLYPDGQRSYEPKRKRKVTRIFWTLKFCS
jgi:hypothetical protein